jgi:hypothetical protein
VYQQSVRGRKSEDKPWVAKSQQSTFFPDSASKDDVMTAITSALESPRKIVKYPQSMRGIGLIKTGDTIYPAGGTDGKEPDDLTQD